MNKVFDKRGVYLEVGDTFYVLRHSLLPNEFFTLDRYYKDDRGIDKVAFECVIMSSRCRYSEEVNYLNICCTVLRMNPEPIDNQHLFEWE